MKTTIVSVFISLFLFTAPLVAQPAPEIQTGAEQTAQYLNLLAGRRVGIVTNHTGLIGGTHIVDSLKTLGVDVRIVMAPEHGFRGEVDAGGHVAGYVDKRTGIEIASIYGATKKPTPAMLKKVDIVVFDIQDVGTRFYTYLSSLHYVMEACAEGGVPLIVLDRPNPNGSYVDGPVLDPEHRSFVGLHPIPVVHGMTLGELAKMINGERWLAGGVQCGLTVVPCNNYSREMPYRLSMQPSPNLPTMRSVYLYPSLCFFEGTVVSIGRGTDSPFECYGHPSMRGYPFSFIPISLPEAVNPPLRNQLCYGVDLRTSPPTEEQIRSINLDYVIECYNKLAIGEKFFTPMFEKLMGVSYVRQMIVEGRSAAQIRGQWRGDVARFKLQRVPYLIYD